MNMYVIFTFILSVYFNICSHKVFPDRNIYQYPLLTAFGSRSNFYLCGDKNGAENWVVYNPNPNASDGELDYDSDTCQKVVVMLAQ